MEVEKSSVNGTEHNNKNAAADPHPSKDTEPVADKAANENLNLAPNIEETHENIVSKSEKSVDSNEENVSECQNTQEIEDLAENNDKEGEEAKTADSDSPDGVYMDRDELIQSVLNEPYSGPPRKYLQCMSSPENSDHSEFDMSDDKDDFELWSSDSTSPEFSDDPEAVEMETTDEDKKQSKQVQKPSKKIIPVDYWKDIQQERIKKFEFMRNPHVVEPDLKEKLTPLQCFKLFVDDNVINLLVSETNKFARSKFIRPGYHKDFLTGWIDVTPQEMREFIGLLIFMTSRRFPGTKYYWSGDRDFSNPVAGRVMTETRFKRLLTFWHFGDDKDREDYPKIRNLLNILNENFKKYREPERIMYVGKATLFLREKYAFQRHLIGIPKRGQRLLRLLDSEIYTYKVVTMKPESCDDRISKTKQAVLNLLQNYLNEGRLVVFHNLFVSMDMAQELLNNKTHVVGPMRKKARNTPAELCKLKVRNNEVKGFQSSEGISVLKWKTWGQTCYGLSTCHGTEMVQVEKLNKRDGRMFVKEQAKILRDLNISDKVFDLAEKFSVTESPLNNETTWYRRLANDLLTGTCVSNAFCLYKQISNEKVKFYKFQDQLWREMVGFKCTKEESSEDTSDDEG